MSTTRDPIPIGPDPALLARPDALSTVGGRIGTAPGPETYPHPGANFLQNLGMILNESLTITPEMLGVDLGTPEKFWDPRLMGLLAGTIAVIEPGPGGEARTASNVMKDLGPLEGVVEAAKQFMRRSNKTIDKQVDEFNSVASEFGLALEKPSGAMHGQYVLKDMNTNTILSSLGDPGDIVPEIGAAIYRRSVGDKIVGSAVRLKDGRVIAGPSPHIEDIWDEAVSTRRVTQPPGVGVVNKDVDEIGFITNKGTFVSEEQALPIAQRARQTKKGSFGEVAEGREAAFLGAGDLEYPLPWHEFNQGRDFEELIQAIGQDPDELYHLMVGGEEFLNALERAEGPYLNPASNFFADLLRTSQTGFTHRTIPRQAIEESARSAMFRTGAEAGRRAILGDRELFESLTRQIPAEALGEFLSGSLEQGRTSAVLAELIRRAGFGY